MNSACMEKHKMHVSRACMCQVTKAHEGLPHIKAICNLQYMKAKPSSIYTSLVGGGIMGVGL